MELSESNKVKLEVLINDIYELSCKFPNLAHDIVNTNINYRAWILNQWLADMTQDIDFDIEGSISYNEI